MAIAKLNQINIPWMNGFTKPPLVPNDLKLVKNGIQYKQNNSELDYLWYQVEEEENGQKYAGYRVVRLLELKFIPLDARADAGLLQKMRTVLRSLYGAKVSFVYLTAGLFTDPAVGIIQCYGVSVFAADLETAVAKSAGALATLQSAMSAAYRQLKMKPLESHTASWIFEAMGSMKNALVVVGQPDPRENAKGGSDPAFRNPIVEGSPSAQQYTLQQNEILFRGMSKLREDFLFLVMTSPVSFSNISEMLIGLAEYTSTWASRQLGSRGASFGISLPAILVGSMANNTSQALGTNDASSHTDGTTHTEGTTHTDGTAHTDGHAQSQGWSHVETNGQTITDTTSHSDGATNTQGSAHTQGQSTGQSNGVTNTEGQSASVGASVGAGVPGVANASVNAEAGLSSSQAVSSGQNQEQMSSDTASQSTSVSSVDSSSHSVSNSHSESNGSSGSVTESTANTTSQSDAASKSDAASQSDSSMHGTSNSKVMGQGTTNGLSVGVSPSFSVSEMYQWQSDPAILITKILRMQEALLEGASREGGYYCDVYAFTRTPEAKQAMMGLVPEAFAGTEDVVTGVQTRDLLPAEEAYIINHAQVFSPSKRIENIPLVMSGYLDSTLLTLLQVAAYSSPGMYELGTAVTVQESTPDFAFYPETKGNVVIGQQWSSELAEITEVPLRLSPERHFHTAFCGDTGFGKSVAAERLAYETTKDWHYRTIILDFGQGWRRALNWPGLHGRVDVRQIFPGASRPLRWNILQVPKRMDPGRYRMMFAELFANAGRMGPRQLGYLRRAITEEYIEKGVIRALEKSHDGYQVVRNADEIKAVLTRQMEQHLPPTVLRIGDKMDNLLPYEVQAIVVERSKQASIVNVIRRLHEALESTGRNDQTARTSLEGLLLRLETFEEGELARMYGAGPDSLPVEDLGLLGPKEDPWGMVVIEGGAEMSDEFSKIAILSLLASVLYFDAVSRRRESLAGVKFPRMQIFFEEANKILSGVSSGGATSDQPTASSSVSDIFQTMWRDGRKYSIFLHLMAQTISELPEGIFASCNNLFAVQTKNPKDRDLLMAAIGRSEKGFVNTEFKRFFGRVPAQMAVVKLGYSIDVTQLEPMLIHPLMVPGDEPNDQQIVEILRKQNGGK